MRTTLSLVTLAAAAFLGSTPPAHAAEPAPCTPMATHPNLIAGTLDLLDAATYSINTTFESDGRTVRRTLPAVPNVPMLVNVDGGLLPLPDLRVELRLLSTTKATLLVDRVATASRHLPVRVEVRVEPPTGGDGDLGLAFGYDTRAGAQPGAEGEAPEKFSAALAFSVGQRLPDDRGTRSVLEPTITTEHAGDRLDLIAAADVAGENAQRIGATAELVPPPSKLALRVDDTCDADVRTTDVHVDTDGETVVTGDASVTRDGVRRDVHVVVDRLIDTTAVHVVRELLADKDHADYHASHDVARADVRVDEYVPGSDTQLARQALARVDGVPAAGFAVDHEGRGPADPRVEFRTLGGALTQVEGGIAEGRPVHLLSDDEISLLTAGRDLRGAVPAYADLADDGAAVRIFGLRSAVLDLAERQQAGDLRLEAAMESRPLLLRQVRGARTTVAQVLNAPSAVALRLEKPDPLVAGDPLVLEYTGSESIELIHATVNDPEGVVKRAEGPSPATAEFTAEGVPTCLRVVKRDGGDLYANTARGVDDLEAGCSRDDALGELSARLQTVTDGIPDQLSGDNRLPDNAEGFAVQDLDDEFVLQGRISGLRSVVLRAPEPQEQDAPDFRTDTVSKLDVQLRRASSADRPLVIHHDAQDKGVGKAIRYLDVRLQRLPATVFLTIDSTDRRISTHPGCSTKDFASGVCDSGTEIRYNGSEPVEGTTGLAAQPALRIDTNGGLREGPFVATRLLAGNPNLRLEIPTLPARVSFCQATFDFCATGPDGRVPETQVRLDASQDFGVELFDCRARGREDVFDVGTCDSDDTDPARNQQSSVVDIEQIRFLEADLDIPAPAADDTPGFIYLNTNPNPLGVHTAVSGEFGHLVDGDGIQDVDHDGTAPDGDVFLLASRRSSSSCPPKTKTMEMRFDRLSADHRLINFNLTGDGSCLLGTSGFNVKSREGDIECNSSRFDADRGEGFGGLRTEICGLFGG